MSALGAAAALASPLLVLCVPPAAELQAARSTTPAAASGAASHRPGRLVWIADIVGVLFLPRTLAAAGLKLAAASGSELCDGPELLVKPRERTHAFTTVYFAIAVTIIIGSPGRARARCSVAATDPDRPAPAACRCRCSVRGSTAGAQNSPIGDTAACASLPGMSTMHDRSPELRRADGGPIRVLVVDDEATLSKPAVHRAKTIDAGDHS
jgi:hypothetical protein